MRDIKKNQSSNQLTVWIANKRKVEIKGQSEQKTDLLWWIKESLTFFFEKLKVFM